MPRHKFYVVKCCYVSVISFQRDSASYSRLTFIFTMNITDIYIKHVRPMFLDTLCVDELRKRFNCYL